MCGIAGIINFNHKPISNRDLILMADCLSHRGPDGEGFALLANLPEKCSFHTADELRRKTHKTFCGFVHRRLAIIDLSSDGIQPMANASGSLWITYNGEIFNYIELRKELQSLGRDFRTATDTEVLLQGYDQWGMDCFHRFNGMWAFVIADIRRKCFVICRDRFGIKPLYYSNAGDNFAFASEPKALLKLDWVRKEPDERAIADYLIHSREDCFEWTFFKGIKRLEPGCYLEIPFDCNIFPTPRQWWNIIDSFNKQSCSRQETAEEQFRSLFTSSVKLRLRSDVPVGTCLSGGLDSSAVLCVARPWLTKENQKSYSAVYDSSFEEDETRYIDEITKLTSVDNFQVRPTGKKLLQDLDQLIYMQDEPFGSTSQYAQYSVFRLVRDKGTTVTLDGQGADEMLGGYHYLFPVHFAGYLRKMRILRALSEISKYRTNTNAALVPTVLSTLAGFLSHRKMLCWANRYDPGRSVRWVNDYFVKLAKDIPVPSIPTFQDPLNSRLYELFSVSSLPALLRYEDRNSMAFSVEARLPFMDYRLVSFLFSLPPEQKIRKGFTKHVMREAIKGIVPEAIRKRTGKIGFATPEAQWFGQGDSLSFIRDVINSRRTIERGIYNTSQLLDFINANAAGKIRAGRAIWRALNLELWFRRFID
jgi:asparagine synthase (glutamine-hydrolysing)